MVRAFFILPVSKKPDLGPAAIRAITGLLAFALLLSPSVSAAQATQNTVASERLSETVETAHARSTLSAETTAFAPGETIWFVFQQVLEENWHVYWRNPGDSGLPLEFRWTLPEGFTAGDIVYPSPERIPVGPFVNYGHHGAPVFMAPITAPADLAVGAAVPINLSATWLICEEICVPEDGAFSLNVPTAATAANDPSVKAIADAFRAAAPAAFPADANFAATEDGLVLSFDVADITGDIEDAYFFSAAEGVIEPSTPQRVTKDGARLLIKTAAGLYYEPETLEKVAGVLSLGSEKKGAERRAFSVTAQPADDGGERILASIGAAGVNISGGQAGGQVSGQAGVQATGAPPNIPLLLLAAFFGGLILNVMPCVFPIIFIKAASFLRAAQEAPGVARRHGLLYVGGVVATFAALGALLLVLRAGGEQLGWGFHLQSPIVVALSAYVLFLVGLNLAGVFHVGEGLQNVGAGLADKGGDAGAFFTGVLAVFVAAPCIGPLLSAPMGAAVLLPPAIGMLIFVTMALGLAAPYALLSFAPQLGRYLPKPGAWMETFKQALAFPVFAAAAFFVWVLAQQSGQSGLAIMLGGLIALSLAAWLFEQSKQRLNNDRPGGMIWRGVAVIALLGAIVPASQLKLADPAGAGAKGGYGALEAMAYDPDMIVETRADGAGVFVDFTAAWCVTCQVNKATVLSKPSVGKLFNENDVRVMAADWTRRDPMITKALEAFGANGVPLYVYYPPAGAPRVVPLPLTERAIRNAVEAGVQSAASQ